jgi:hypothetical protein
MEPETKLYTGPRSLVMEETFIILLSWTREVIKLRRRSNHWVTLMGQSPSAAQLLSTVPACYAAGSSPCSYKTSYWNLSSDYSCPIPSHLFRFNIILSPVSGFSSYTFPPHLSAQILYACVVTCVVHSAPPPTHHLWFHNHNIVGWNPQIMQFSHPPVINLAVPYILPNVMLTHAIPIMWERLNFTIMQNNG